MSKVSRIRHLVKPSGLLRITDTDKIRSFLKAVADWLQTKITRNEY